MALIVLVQMEPDLAMVEENCCSSNLTCLTMYIGHYSNEDNLKTPMSRMRSGATKIIYMNNEFIRTIAPKSHNFFRDQCN